MSITPTAQLDFLNNIQKLLSDGAVNTTYKYALLLAIADLAVEKGTDSADEWFLHLDNIAAKVIALYWGQTLPYPVNASATSRLERTASEIILIQRQQRDEPPKIIKDISTARQTVGHSLARLLKDEDNRQKLIKNVRDAIKKNPLDRLQEGFSEKFLYDPKHIVGGGIYLRPGVSFCLRRFYPLIYDLIRARWVRVVREWNEDILGDATELDTFMFGQQRSHLKEVGLFLKQLQSGQCFYCEQSINSQDLAVDHFIPWARYPRDDLFNFVAAHASCNLNKRDYLVGIKFLEMWIARNVSFDFNLQQGSLELGFPADSPVTTSIAAWAYGSASSIGENVWTGGKNFEPMDDEWRELLDRQCY
jgi:hypothetical protein